MTYMLLYMEKCNTEAKVIKRILCWFMIRRQKIHIIMIHYSQFRQLQLDLLIITYLLIYMGHLAGCDDKKKDFFNFACGAGLCNWLHFKKFDN